MIHKNNMNIDLNTLSLIRKLISQFVDKAIDNKAVGNNSNSNFTSLILIDEHTNKKYRLHVVDRTLTMTEVE